MTGRRSPSSNEGPAGQRPGLPRLLRLPTADGYPSLWPNHSTTARQDCQGMHRGRLIPVGAPPIGNDQIAVVHTGSNRVVQRPRRNCDGQIDEGNPEGRAACNIPGLLAGLADVR